VSGSPEFYPLNLLPCCLDEEVTAPSVPHQGVDLSQQVFRDHDMGA
jgi:hypothetical protein